VTLAFALALMYQAGMTRDPGLGELLRHLGELVDTGATERYRLLGLEWRPRYTPVLRALLAGAATVTDITTHSRLTQGAVSQTVALMIADGFLTRDAVEDGRKSALHLTDKGAGLAERLAAHWRHTFTAIEGLEAETGQPLRQALVAAIEALERKGFAERLREAGA
jgi:MarR family transcriptional regulator, organic hydroperoxide resistance regulator